MTLADLPDIERIAAAVHPDHPEDRAVFAERLRLFPAGCLILSAHATAQGYAFGHPWVRARPPKLNRLLGQRPDTPDTFYIHDLALLPSVRARGWAGSAIAAFVAQARQAGLPTITLVAVGGSVPFWRHHGFEPVPDPALQRGLSSYGDTACYMVRPA